MEELDIKQIVSDFEILRSKAEELQSIVDVCVEFRKAIDQLSEEREETVKQLLKGLTPKTHPLEKEKEISYGEARYQLYKQGLGMKYWERTELVHNPIDALKSKPQLLDRMKEIVSKKGTWHQKQKKERIDLVKEVVNVDIGRIEPPEIELKSQKLVIRQNRVAGWRSWVEQNGKLTEYECETPQTIRMDEDYEDIYYKIGKKGATIVRIRMTDGALPIWDTILLYQLHEETKAYLENFKRQLEKRYNEMKTYFEDWKKRAMVHLSADLL